MPSLVFVNVISVGPLRTAQTASVRTTAAIMGCVQTALAHVRMASVDPIAVHFLASTIVPATDRV